MPKDDDRAGPSKFEVCFTADSTNVMFAGLASVRLHEVTVTGIPVRTFQTERSCKGYLGVQTDGKVVVACGVDDVVVVFDYPTASVLSSFRRCEPVASPLKPAKFHGGTSLALTRDHHIVVDIKGEKLVRFTLDGACVGQVFGGSVASVTETAAGELVVVKGNRTEVVILGPSGEEEALLPPSGGTWRQAYAVTSHGTSIWVLDTLWACVFMYE